MRIVQTFWTAGRNPLEHSFGWLRPEYNLMSWALSCLSLRQHYDEVALYTDEQGKHVLIDLLHLPYTEVNVVYDEHLCLPQHWAYAKIKTYSVQMKPFLHVDGDVFLPKPLPEDIMAAPLIAQNKERGTEYYRKMMDNLLKESSLKLPEYLEDALRGESISSYNMGVFGGHDLDFIHAFCEDALAVCGANMATCTNGNFNLLFEQILLACSVQEEGRVVGTVFTQTFCDNGYTTKDFCDLDRYGQKGYFHLLGGHKRDKALTEALEEVLIARYPDYYKAVVSLFPHLLPRGLTKGTVSLLMMTPDLRIKPYFDFLSEAEREWNRLTWEELHEVELRRIKGRDLSLGEEWQKAETVVCCNPYLKCFDVPTSWDEEARQLLRSRLSMREDAPLERVAVIPTLTSRRKREFALYELELQVLKELRRKPMQVSELLTTLTASSENMRILWLQEIRILLCEGLIITSYYNKP